MVALVVRPSCDWMSVGRRLNVRELTRMRIAMHNIGSMHARVHCTCKMTRQDLDSFHTGCILAEKAFLTRICHTQVGSTPKITVPRDKRSKSDSARAPPSKERQHNCDASTDVTLNVAESCCCQEGSMQVRRWRSQQCSLSIV